MAKHSSDQQCRSRTKYTEKKRYGELYDMVSEWMGKYQDEKTIFINRVEFRKYNAIRKLLRRDFVHDNDMKANIKSLPNILLFRSWLIEAMLLLCVAIFSIFNPIVFKIETGVFIADKVGRGHSDIIYLVFNILLLAIYPFAYAMRIRKLKSVESNLSAIRHIAWQKK